MQLAVIIILTACAGFINAYHHGMDDDLDGMPAEALSRRKCPPWGKWQKSKCLWVASQPFSSLPNSCTALPRKPQMRDAVKAFFAAKELEVYSIIQNLYKLRGANSPCGSCSRKISCRQRRGGVYKEGCQYVQVKVEPDQCPGQEACVIKPILGACPPPIPNLKRRRRHHHHHRHPRQASMFEVIPDQEMSDLDDEPERNKTQGPPFWNCARNKDGSKCFCCCGWLLPNVTSGKCFRFREGTDDENDDVDTTWTGMIDLAKENPFDENSGFFDDSITQQLLSYTLHTVPQNAPFVDAVELDPHRELREEEGLARHQMNEI